MRSLAPRAAILVVCALLAGAAGAACGAPEPTPSPTTETSLVEQAPEPAERCRASVAVSKVVLASGDGVKLAGAEYGSGARGVVLVHQRESDLCGWTEYAAELAGQGFHVLAIDLRCHGWSNCDREDVTDLADGTFDYAGDAGAAVAHLRRAGAGKVVVMGASMGAVAAFVAAGRFPDQVSGVVALSMFSASFNASGTADPAVRSATDAAPHIAAPILIGLAARDSSSISEADAKALVAAAPGSGTVVARKGSSHGWELLRPSTDNVTQEVLAFLNANT